MWPHVPGGSGPWGGDLRAHATPPSTLSVNPLSVPAATSRLDSATGSPRGPWPGMSWLRLTGREQEVDVIAVGVEIDYHALQDVGGVVAAWVQTQRRPDLLCASRLVDVAVQTDHGLVLLDRLAHRLAAHGDDARLAAAQHRHEVRVQLGREVEPGRVRRGVGVEHHLAARGAWVPRT